MKKNNLFLLLGMTVCCFLVSCGNEKGSDSKEGDKKLTDKRPVFSSVLSSAEQEKPKPAKSKINKPIKIAILGLENNPFWIPVKGGTLKAKAELKKYNCEVDWIVPAGDSHGASVFGKGIENAVIQGYDAIATVAGDSGIVNFINRAVDSGIPVATFNSETEKENKRLFFVGADLYKQGEVAGTEMIKLIGDKGEVAVITGFFSVEAHELRRKGFLDTLKKKAPNIKIVSEVENKDQASAAYRQTKDFLTAYPNLSAIYVTAGGPFGAAKAVEESKKTGVVKIISYDFVDETMEFVKKGVISGTIGQDPHAQGYDPAIRLYNYVSAGIVPKAGKLLTKSDFVTKDNIDKFWSKVK
jgi:ribose transport system substrate-binding protein